MEDREDKAVLYWIDSREKKNQNITKYFDKHKIEYEVKKLDVGDYMSSDNPFVSIDKKFGLGEIAGNLCSKDCGRFYREVRRAKENGIKLIFLIEEPNIKSLADVSSWQSKYSRISGSRLQAEMYRVGIAYNIQFEFCSKRSTGKRIMELLTEN